MPNQSHTYYTYILASRRNGALYTGVTNNIIRRVAQHRAGSAESCTRRNKVHQLVWFETREDIEEAIIREKRIKKWRRAWKIEMIEKTNKNWRDLYSEICG